MKNLHLFIEILQLVGTLLADFIVLLIIRVIQSHILTKEYSESHANFMDEFLYGEKFR